MATSNPAFSQDIFAGYNQVYGVPRSTVTTVQGTMAKTFLLLAIMSATALWSFYAVASDQLQLGVIPVAGIAGFILAMVTIFKPTVAPWTSPVTRPWKGCSWVPSRKLWKCGTAKSIQVLLFKL